MLRSSSRASRWKGAGASAVLTMALSALAYRFPAVVSIDFGRGIEGFFGSSGFFDREGEYRWSRARSEIVFPDPGARDPVRLELVLSGFRPPGSEPPRVVIESGGRSLTITPSRRIETYSLETKSTGLWSSTLGVQVRSDTFVPGGGDERALGVRLHRARLILEGPALPPLKPILASGAAAALLAVCLGAPAALATGVLLGFGFHFFRFHAALLAPLLAWGALAAFLVARLFPGSGKLAGEIARAFQGAILDGVRALRGRRLVPVAGLLILGTTASYALRPRFDLGLGTGVAEPLLQRFAGFDRDGAGVVFRRAFPGATIDLRDFGASSSWAVSITYSGEADGGFETRRVELERTRWGFRSGPLLRFPGVVQGRAIRVSRVEVERGRSLPPLRVLVIVLASWALFLAAFGACGLSPPWAQALGSAFSGLVVVGLGFAPSFFVPFLSPIALAASASLFAASLARVILPSVSNGGLAIATAAFCLWFLATASPLYSGGHFAYHSSVAEEISQGKFFLYYFPGPDNMLSHQPQWGNMTVPHPSLYHTVTSPLALLPREWFHLGTKLFLSLLLFGVTLASSVVAQAAGGRRAGIYAAAAAAAFPTGWQLLGLGHLMTLFGTFAAAAALGFVALAGARLTKRREWLFALALVTFAFLSYTGSLLFGSVALAFVSLALLRSEPELARSTFRLLLAGWALALALYYIHWVIPFFQDTLPAMLRGSGSDAGIDWGARLKLLPEKVEYTFGSFWVPLFGLYGLTRAQGRSSRLLLYGWALSLPLFSGLDLAFNFLLKHHYFSFPAIAIGFGLTLRRLEEKGTFGMAVFGLVIVYLWVTGLLAVWHLATGAS